MKIEAKDFTGGSAILLDMKYDYFLREKYDYYDQPFGYSLKEEIYIYIYFDMSTQE
jgi:hypothetical protein